MSNDITLLVLIGILSLTLPICMLFSNLLGRVKRSLLDLRKNGLNSLDKDIRIVESYIYDIDSHSLNYSLGSNEDTDLFITRRSLHNKYNTLLRKSNIRWAQQSCLMWVLNGDLNTTLFHTSAHMNKHKSFIFQILDHHGNIQTSKKGIEQVFLSHYINLWSDNSDNSLLILSEPSSLIYSPFFLKMESTLLKVSSEVKFSNRYCL